MADQSFQGDPELQELANVVPPGAAVVTMGLTEIEKKLVERAFQQEVTLQNLRKNFEDNEAVIKRLRDDVRDGQMEQERLDEIYREKVASRGEIIEIKKLLGTSPIMCDVIALLEYRGKSKIPRVNNVKENFRKVWNFSETVKARKRTVKASLKDLLQKAESVKKLNRRLVTDDEVHRALAAAKAAFNDFNDTQKELKSLRAIIEDFKLTDAEINRGLTTLAKICEENKKIEESFPDVDAVENKLKCHRAKHSQVVQQLAENKAMRNDVLNRIQVIEKKLKESEREGENNKKRVKALEIVQHVEEGKLLEIEEKIKKKTTKIAKKKALKEKMTNNLEDERKATGERVRVLQEQLDTSRIHVQSIKNKKELIDNELQILLTKNLKLGDEIKSRQDYLKELEAKRAEEEKATKSHQAEALEKLKAAKNMLEQELEKRENDVKDAEKADIEVDAGFHLYERVNQDMDLKISEGTEKFQQLEKELMQAREKNEVMSLKLKKLTDVWQLSDEILADLSDKDKANEIIITLKTSGKVSRKMMEDSMENIAAEIKANKIRSAAEALKLEEELEDLERAHVEAEEKLKDIRQATLEMEAERDRKLEEKKKLFESIKIKQEDILAIKNENLRIDFDMKNKEYGSETLAEPIKSDPYDSQDFWDPTNVPQSTPRASEDEEKGKEKKRTGRRIYLPPQSPEF